ncbi:MAG: TIR domain-containing protein, partial [Lachnospiraceae bacterium]|nr:TIR domain-containing protein [Lachnospiraceae bacterium]
MSEGATLLLCEKCGAGYDLSKGGRTVRCSYCGTYATLPINLTSQWTEIFNRGNAYRKNNDFEKAVSLYEDYLKNNPTDAEAHWQCALARFGIEYVQDPDTKDFIPTFRMLSFDSFLEDYDYLSSVSYSEGEAKIYYQKEAQRIAELMGRQIAVARNERPYDIFISYKETDDETEERTPDSIRAQELYEMLVQKGYRVFFARISLEEKAGAEFEPYIFAALNSAKVMLVVGSDRKNFEATWVKNEWQRFNALRKKDLSGRLLIPCIFNMSAKDLPNSLKGLQAIDLGIPGSNQQVVLSVSKCVNLSRNNQYVTGQGGIQQQSYRPTMQPVVQQPPVQIRPVAPKPPVKKYTAEEMIEMAKADLARGCFRESRGKCDAVLKDHPQNENALFTAFLASNGMPKEEMLKKRFDKKVEKSPYYQKLMECASEELKGRLLQYKQTYKTQKRVKTIIGLVVCGIIIAAATVVVFRVRNKIYLQLINHYITDSKELTNDIVDYYKEDADAKLSQYVPSDQSGEAYQIITGNPEYLGYCLATNSDDTSDNTNAVYYLYCYDAEWEITRDEILASDKVYKEQHLVCYPS